MDRRFTDAEVAEILSGAAQREAGGGKDGWTTEQVLAMAAELGISADSVRAELARSGPEAAPAGGTTEVIPGRFTGVGAPKGMQLRRRMRGALPQSAIEDAAEDARRSFSKVRRLERRPDELIVEGTFYDAEASIYVEAGPKYSTMQMALDFSRIARFIHVVWQVFGFLVTMAVWNSIDKPSGPWMFMPLLVFATVAYALSLVCVGLASRRIIAKAERTFEVQANRAVRMLHAAHPELSQEAADGTEKAALQARLRSQT